MSIFFLILRFAVLLCTYIKGFDMNDKQKKVRITPSDAPKFVRMVTDDIIDVLKNPNSQYSAEPTTLSHFKEIRGTHKDNEFVVKHIEAKSRDQREQLYVSYGNFEFYSDLANLRDFFERADACIKHKFVYDLNSKSYVPRPEEIGFFKDVSQWLKFRIVKQRAK